MQTLLKETEKYNINMKGNLCISWEIQTHILPVFCTYFCKGKKDCLFIVFIIHLLLTYSIDPDAFCDLLSGF